MGGTPWQGCQRSELLVNVNYSVGNVTLGFGTDKCASSLLWHGFSDRERNQIWYKLNSQGKFACIKISRVSFWKERLISTLWGESERVCVCEFIPFNE